MPIVNGAYKNPGWVNNAPPVINATELNAMSNTLESAFTSFPENYSSDLNTFRALGSFTRNNFAISNAPPGSSVYGVIYNVSGKSSSYIIQYYFDAAKKITWCREFVDTAWTSWVEPLNNVSMIPGWKLLWNSASAGSGNFVVPDINKGRAYKIGVFVIGAGQGGGAIRASNWGGW